MNYRAFVFRILLLLCLLGELVSCQQEPEEDTAVVSIAEETATAEPTPAPPTVPKSTATTAPTETPQPTATPTVTVVPTPTLTPTPTSLYPDLTDEEKFAQSLLMIFEAEQLLMDGNFEEAIAKYNEMLALAQELNEKEMIGMAYHYRGQANAGIGDYKSAIADFEATLLYETEDAGVHNNLCWWYGLLSEPEKGLPHCNQAIALNPKSNYHDSRGVVLALLDNNTDAATDFQIVLDDLAANPDPWLREMRAERGIWLAVLEEGQNPIVPEVVQILENEGGLDRIVPAEAIEDMPLMQALNHFWVARDHHNNARWEEAIDAYSEAIAIYPDFAEAYYFRGIAHRLNLEEELAIADYDQAIALNPEHAPAYHLRGLVLGSLGDYEQAIESYARAIEIDPLNPEYYRITGSDLMALGRNEEALEYLDKTLELNPDDMLALMIRGIVHHELGNEQQALTDLEKSFDMGLADSYVPQELVSTAEEILATLQAEQPAEESGAELASIPDRIVERESLSLPANFLPMSPEEVGVGPGQTAYTHWEGGEPVRTFEVEKSFAFMSQTPFEIIFGYLLTLEDDSGRQIIDEAITNLVAQMENDVTTSGGTAEEVLPIEVGEIGDIASGAAVHSPSDTPPTTINILMFRQGDVVGMVYQFLEFDVDPSAQIIEVARALVSLLNTAETESDAGSSPDSTTVTPSSEADSDQEQTTFESITY